MNPLLHHEHVSMFAQVVVLWAPYVVVSVTATIAHLLHSILFSRKR